MSELIDTTGFYLKDLWVKEIHSIAEDVLKTRKKVNTKAVGDLYDSMLPHNEKYGEILQSISSRVYSEQLEALAPTIFKMFSKMTMACSIYIDSDDKNKCKAAEVLQGVLTKHSVLSNKSTILRIDSAKIAIKDISAIKETHLTALGIAEFETKLIDALKKYDEIKEGRSDLITSLNGAGENERQFVIKYLSYIFVEINKQQDLHNSESALVKPVQKVIDDYRKRIITRKTLNQKKKDEKKNGGKK